MTDIEMMELAALAAGYVIESYTASGAAWVYPKGAPLTNDGDLPIFWWNPKDNDDDSRRLEVALGMQVDIGKAPHESVYATITTAENHLVASMKLGPDPYAATRLAVLRAAAEVGKRMRDQSKITPCQN